MTGIELQKEVRTALSKGLRIPVVKYLAEYRGRYPVVIYREISNVPSLSADNREKQFRCTYQVSIATKDDEYGALEEGVEQIMTDLGFRRLDSRDIFDGMFFRVIRFVIVCEK